MIMTEREVRLLRDCFESADMFDRLSSMNEVFAAQLEFIDRSIKSGHIFPGEAAAAKADVMQLARRRFDIEIIYVTEETNG